MIDVLDREVEFVFVPFWVAAELAAPVSQHAQQLDIVLLEERQRPVIEQIRRRDRRFAVVELGKADLGVSVDEGLLVDASNTLQIADIERILGAAVTWMSASAFLVEQGYGVRDARDEPAQAREQQQFFDLPDHDVLPGRSRRLQ